MFSIPRGYRECVGAWWFAGTFSGFDMEKIQIIVDNGGDDWYRSTAVKSVEISAEMSEQNGFTVLIARTESGSVYALPLKYMQVSGQMEAIRSESAPNAVLLHEYLQHDKVKHLLGMSEEFDLNTLIKPKPLTRDDLLELAIEVRKQLEKINKMYNDMFLKAGIDLETMKRIDEPDPSDRSPVDRFSSAYPDA